MTTTEHDVRVSRLGHLAYCETCGWKTEAPGMRTALRLAEQHQLDTAARAATEGDPS